MFNQRVQRTGNTVGTSTLKRSAAIVGTAGIVGSLLLAGPVAATAATTHSTYAQGRFLSGSVAGMNLANIAELTPATARNNGAQNTQEVVDPLAVSLLGSSPIEVGAVRVSPDDVVSTSTTGGVLSQYARAEKTGTAVGASGTVGQGGAIGPNASNPGGALTLSFDSLINDSFASVIGDLRLEIQAVAAQAKGTPTSVSGDYFIDGLTLKFTSPAIAGLTDTITTAVDGVDGSLDELTGANGGIALALGNILAVANPALNLAGTANVSVSLGTDLRAAIADLLVADYSGQGVSVNLTTGEVTVDLEKLVGGDLNNKPVGYEVLTGATVTRIVSTIADNVSTLADQVIDRIDLALHNAQLDVDADLSLLTNQAPLLGEICTQQGTGGGLIGGLIGGVVGGVVGGVLCTPTTTILPALETTASVDVHGTVNQVLNGQAPATITAKVLGIPVNLSSGHLLDVLGLELADGLFGTGGAIGNLSGLLDGPLLSQVNTGLLGATSVDTVLSDLLSIKLNLQETTLGGGGLAVAENTLFTETALRVAVANGVGSGGLTTLSVAAASVAPVVTGVGDPGDPGDPGTPGNPGQPSTPAANASGNLAYTGAGIATLIALLLALLAAGTYLAREGYRRNHPNELA